MTKIIRDLHGQILQLRAELRQQSNESSMQYEYITAVHVGLIRVGGFVRPNVPVTQQDWDSWNYVQRNNKRDDTVQCRRRYHELQKVVHRRRRHSTPTRTAHHEEPEEEEDLEEIPSPNRGDDPEWPGGFREQQRQDLPEAFEEDGEEPNANADDEEESFPLEQEDEEEEEESEHSFHSGTNDTVYSEFMQNEYLEWGTIDWTVAHERAKLSALEKILEFSKRQAKAIGDGYDRLADWCASQCNMHRLYARAGTFTLDM
eukprot:s2765_g12.t1